MLSVDLNTRYWRLMQYFIKASKLKKFNIIISFLIFYWWWWWWWSLQFPLQRFEKDEIMWNIFKYKKMKVLFLHKTRVDDWVFSNFTNASDRVPLSLITITARVSNLWRLPLFFYIFLITLFFIKVVKQNFKKYTFYITLYYYTDTLHGHITKSSASHTVHIPF